MNAPNVLESIGPDPRLHVVARLLNMYRGASPAEEAHRREMAELVHTADPLARTQFAPGHFTASALVVSPSDRRVLLIAHPTLGLWLQPGGHIEPADPGPCEAAAREVHEETGCNADVTSALFDVDIHDIPARRSDPQHRHYDLRFLASVTGQPEPSGSEGVEARWLSYDHAWQITTDASVRRMLVKARAAGLL